MAEVSEIKSSIYLSIYNSNVFWNHTWLIAQWRTLCTKFTEVILYAFVYRLFHSDFSSKVGINPILAQDLDLF